MTDDPKSHETAQGARPSRDELLRQHYGATPARRTILPSDLRELERLSIDFTRSSLASWAAGLESRLNAGSDEAGGYVWADGDAAIRTFCPQTAEAWIGLDLSKEPDGNAVTFRAPNSGRTLIFDRALDAQTMESIRDAIRTGDETLLDGWLTQEERERAAIFVRAVHWDIARAGQVRKPQPPPPPPPQGRFPDRESMIEEVGRFVDARPDKLRHEEEQRRHAKRRRIVVGGVLGFTLAFMFFMLSGFVMGAYAAALATVGLFILGWTVVGSLAALAIGRPR